MPFPGTTVTLRDTAPPRSAPTDTGTAFVAGMTQKGDIDDVLVTSMAEYDRLHGDRVSYGLVYDWLDAFFREGGSRAYVSRVVGPAAANAFVILDDSAVADTLRVEARNPGDWGNSLNVEVLAGDAGGEFKLRISHDTDGVLQTTPSFATKAEAIAWAATNEWIKLVDQASALDPAVVGVTSLASGTDDRTNAVDAHWETALGRFSRELGPGQVAMPGRTTGQAHTDLLEHAAANDRVALLDMADTATAATLVAAAEAARTNGRRGASFSPWATIPGISPGTTRTVPYSAIAAGIRARNDSAGESPNVPAAGVMGQAVYAIGLSQTAWGDADRTLLNDAGVNVARIINGGVRTYGYRTLADPDTDPNWLLLGNARLVMAIVAGGYGIGERYVFAEIDGRGHKIADFAGDLTGELMRWWNAGSLYGDTPEEAFLVDTGPLVNTPETRADLELRAVLSLRLSPMGERIEVEIVNRPITERVS